jgi:hypothetical protein
VIQSDTDLAGFGRTRKSTSQEVVMFGAHCLKTYSHNQDTIALSSGESEFYGIMKAATVGVGIKSSFGDLGLEAGGHRFERCEKHFINEGSWASSTC